MGISHLLLGIKHELQGLREDVSLLGKAIRGNPSDHSITIPEVVIARFEVALGKDRPEAVRDVMDIPLKEGFDAVVYSFTKVHSSQIWCVLESWLNSHIYTRARSNLIPALIRVAGRQRSSNISTS